MNLKALSNTNDEGEIIRFDADSANLCVDSCATGGLTRFKNDFTPGAHNEIDERTSDATTGKILIIGEVMSAYKVKDGDGETFTLCTKMACVPLSKHMLMASQWMGIQEKERGAPTEKRSDCHINDEEAILACDERLRRVIIKHEP